MADATPPPEEKDSADEDLEPDETAPAAGYPATADDAPPTTSNDGGTTRFLQSFLKLTPFLELHERAGDPDKHPTRGKWCFALDFTLHLLAALLILAISAAVAYKTLFPLPPIVH